MGYENQHSKGRICRTQRCTHLFFNGAVFHVDLDELKTLLDTLAEPEEFEKLDDKWKFVVNKMKTDMDRNRRIPKEFYEGFVKAQSESENAWEEAKEKADFSIFAPHLQKMIDMTAEMTGYTDPEKEVYDALLDQYEKGMDSATMDRCLKI